MKEIMPGTRVTVYDPRIEKFKPATVSRRYGMKQPASKLNPINFPQRIYDDLVDVLFDHRPETISKGHFTYGAKSLDEPERVINYDEAPWSYP